MIKLYRRENCKGVAYHEAWMIGSKVIERWGALGERGGTRECQIDDKVEGGWCRES